MSQPKSKAARKAALSIATRPGVAVPAVGNRLPVRRYSGALAVACDQCKIKYRQLPTPRNLAEFNLVTSPTALTEYADRQRRAGVPNSYEVMTEDNGRGDASGGRGEWVIRPT